MLVEQALVGMVTEAEALQEAVRQPQQLLHARVVLVVRNLEQLEDNGVRAHVAQQTLLVTTRLLYVVLDRHAQFGEAYEYLLEYLIVTLGRVTDRGPDIQVNGRFVRHQYLQGQGHAH